MSSKKSCRSEPWSWRKGNVGKIDASRVRKERQKKHRQCSGENSRFVVLLMLMMKMFVVAGGEKEKMEERETEQGI